MIPESIFSAVLAPVGFVAIGAMLILLGEVLLVRSKSLLGRPWNSRLIGSLLAGVGMLALGLALVVSWQWFGSASVESFNPQHPLMRFDPFSALASVLIALVALLSCALAIYYLEAVGINRAAYYALLLLATAGMLIFVAAVDFLSLFVGLELMSLPLYVLAGFDRDRLSSNESGLKHFLIGSFASAILLYGIALLYGATGTTSFAGVRHAFDVDNTFALAGMGLFVVGFAFKLAVAPFHPWAPDVFEGAPASVSAFIAVAVPAAGVFALLRVLALAFAPGESSVLVLPELTTLLAGLAAFSLVIGGSMLLVQDSIKRLLAYSSVMHGGYLLLGIAAGTLEAWSATVFYTIAYAFFTLGAFSIVVALSQRGRDCERIAAFAGLARERPWHAAFMTLFMLALAGFPLTAGFFAKLGVVAAAMNAGLVPVATLSILVGALAVYPYFRLPVLMYLHEPGEFAVPTREAQTMERVVLITCAVAVLALGILPNGGTLLDFSFGEQELRLALPAVQDWSRAAVAALVP